jgi:hypothetical protein
VLRTSIPDAISGQGFDWSVTGGFALVSRAAWEMVERDVPYAAP